jgi:DNA-binding MarR family transcriptional regulator
LKEPAEIINEHLMLMAENIAIFRRFASSTELFKNLTPQELHAITLLGKMGSPRMSELAGRGHVTPGTMSVMINKLVKKGYVKRKRDEEDRRVVRVCLTPSGKRIDRLHHNLHKEMTENLLALLTKSEQHQVAKIVQKIARAVT